MPLIVKRNDLPGRPVKVITNTDDSLGPVAELDGEHVIFKYPDGRTERVSHKDVFRSERAMGLDGYSRWIGPAQC